MQAERSKPKSDLNKMRERWHGIGWNEYLKYYMKKEKEENDSSQNEDWRELKRRYLRHNFIIILIAIIL